MFDLCFNLAVVFYLVILRFVRFLFIPVGDMDMNQLLAWDCGGSGEKERSGYLRMCDNLNCRLEAREEMLEKEKSEKKTRCP